MVFQKYCENARSRYRCIVQRMCEMHFSIRVAVFDVEAPSLEIVEIRGGMRFAVFFLRRKPTLNIVFFYLSKPQISPALQNYMVRQFQSLHYFLGIFRKFFVPFYGFLMVRFAQNNLFHFKKFMYPKNTFGILAVTSGFSPVAGRESCIFFRKF